MLKILLSAVGLHDPLDAGEKEGPVMAAVRELEPDILFLFPTRRQVNEKFTSTEENCRATTAELGKSYQDLKVYERTLNLPDPTDYGKIIKLLTGEIEDIKAQYSGSATEYVVSITSGTPQLQSAFLVLLGSNRLRAKAYQVVDPRYLEPGEDRVRLVDTHFMEESNQINRARKFFNKNSFESAGAELLELACYTIYPEREKKAEVFHDLATCYFHWDLYQHEEALKQVKKCLPQLKKYGFEDLAAVAGEQAAILEEIIALDERENYLNLADLYHNSLRRLQGRQHVDCLNRFKRIYEGAFYYVADTRLNIKQKKVENLPQNIKSLQNRQQGYLSTYDISNLYKRIKGEEIISDNLEHQLNELARQRNMTINNHGMKSVSKKDAEKAMDLVGKLLKKLFPDENIEAYCLSRQTLEKIENMIFDRL